MTRLSNLSFRYAVALFAVLSVTGMGVLSVLGILSVIANTSFAADYSEPAALAAESLLLDVTRAGANLVAVGDRGHVLMSEDEGKSWKQILVPTRAMLTGVSFGDATHGWAVGHDGVILSTADGGKTWVRQDSGADLETVWLDVFFSSDRIGLIAGAYGKCQLTMDGGKTWQPSPIAEEAHLNQIAPTVTDRLYLAGEMGTLLTSADARQGWNKVDVPYDGSLYGALPLDAQRLLVYGLRGSVYYSENAGKTWMQRETAVPVLLMAGLRFKSGVIVLAGIGGNFYLGRDDGKTFGHWQPEAYTGGVSALLEANDGALIVAGEKGVARLQLPLK